MIGKSRLGGRKLNVRIDEGELEIGLCHYASSLLYPNPGQRRTGGRSLRNWLIRRGLS